MSSRRVRSTHSIVGRLGAAALLLLSIQACGRKGDPQPPPRKHPARTTDLQVEQSGQELVLTMSYPTMTIGGLALPGIDRLELHQYTRPAPEFMEQPELPMGEDVAVDESGVAVAATEPTESLVPSESPAATGATPEPATVEPATGEPATGEVVVEDLTAEQTDVEGAAVDPAASPDEAADAAMEEPEEPNPFLRIRVDQKEFDKLVQTVLTLEGDSLEAAVVGGRVVMRLPLADIPTLPPVAYTFAIRTFTGRLRSPESTLASFVPLPPPAAPGDLTATVEARGVALTWATLADESEIEGYRILRRQPQISSLAEPIATLGPGVSEYLDTTARFGSRYVYAVTAVRMEDPLVESAPSEEQTVDRQDVFAPKPPLGLVALSESGRIRLLWDASRERDLAGYLLFVSVSGGEPEQLTPEPIRATEFVHEGTISGATYVYTLRAVDETGNQSEDSAPVTTRAP